MCSQEENDDSPCKSVNVKMKALFSDNDETSMFKMKMEMTEEKTPNELKHRKSIVNTVMCVNLITRIYSSVGSQI